MATIDLKLKSYDELQFEIMRLTTDNYLKQQKIDKAIEYLEEAAEGLEEYHFDGYDPNLPYVISILKGGEDNE